MTPAPHTQGQCGAGNLESEKGQVVMISRKSLYGIKGLGTAATLVLGLAYAMAWGPVAAAEHPPLGPLPKVKAQNSDQVELGKMLFFDNRISGDADISCSVCHIPSKGWADGKQLSKGYPGTEYFRNSKTIINAVHAKFFYWDARLDGQDMPTQVRDAMTESFFMAGDGRIMHQRLKNLPKYVELFKKVYNAEPSFNRILKAISAFERTLVSRNVPFDKFMKGDQTAISAKAKKGLELFKGKAGCIQCHNGSMFTDNEAHNLGVPHNPKIISEVKRHITMRAQMSFLGVPNYHNLKKDPGHFTVTKKYKDFGSFLTPSLREVSRTSPYMHNGMLPTLKAVVDFYNEGGGAHKNKSKRLKPLGLSAGDKDALVAFLKTLSGDEIIIDVPKKTLPKYQAIKDWYKKPN